MGFFIDFLIENYFENWEINPTKKKKQSLCDETVAWNAA